eukprot:c18577_g1_i1.p1 GENE.c18577_g1_i1~~c18577_g1_i1.p1  ORF type:complete len:231 (+),score=93.00 c18577_g1_i1:77-769(+)
MMNPENSQFIPRSKTTSSICTLEGEHQGPRKVTAQEFSNTKKVSPTSVRPKPRGLDSCFEDSVLFPLSKIIEIAIEQGQKYPSKLYLSNTIFELSSAPKITVMAYIRRLATFFPCSKECFTIATVLIGRLETTCASPILSTQTAHSIFLTALLIAHKLHDDVTVKNSFAAEVGGVEPEHLNEMEQEFLKHLTFDTYVSQDQYENYTSLLASIGSRLAKSNGRNTFSDSPF